MEPTTTTLSREAERHARVDGRNAHGLGRMGGVDAVEGCKPDGKTGLLLRTEIVLRQMGRAKSLRAQRPGDGAIIHL